jgi:anaerobic magnesium-protoporphyrin IX monomethyl ester cyclase
VAADMTLVNLNMLYVRYGEKVDRELHVPLGCLYLARALEDAGFAVDFRDYQTCEAQAGQTGDLFDLETFFAFLDRPAPVIGLSCMANLLPFTLLAARALKDRYPDRTIVLGGVGPKAVEDRILRRFPWVDAIVRGEGEVTGPELMWALHGGDLSAVSGLSYRQNGTVRHTADRERIRDLDTIPLPAFEKVALRRYKGYGMMTSRGCPYPCTFCSVAPIWNHESYSRSPQNIIDEMLVLHQEAVGLSL